MGIEVSIDERVPLLQAEKNINIEHIFDHVHKHLKEVYSTHIRRYGKGIYFLRDVEDVNPQHITESDIILKCSDTDLLCKLYDLIKYDGITICIRHNGIYYKQYPLDNLSIPSELVKLI